MRVLDYALAAAHANLRVFPVYGVVNQRCECGTVDCKTPGKHPRIGSWQKEASVDPDKIKAWFGFWPGANYGIAAGEGSKIWILDVDPRHGGDASLARLCTDRGAPPPTLTVRTGSGGLHLYFRYVPGLKNSGGKIGDGVDVRGEGGYVVGPGSIHVSGRPYTVEIDAPIVEAPYWLIDLAMARRVKVSPTVAAAWAPLVFDAVELEAVRAAAGEMVARTPPGIEGKGGGVALMHLCRDIYRGWGLPDDNHTRMLIAEYCARCDPPWTEASQVLHKIEEGKRGDRDPEGREVGYLYRRWKAGRSQLPPIRLDVDEHRCINEVISRMREIEDLYVSPLSQLADVVEMPGDDLDGMLDGVQRMAGAPRIRPLPSARVRTLITLATRIEKWDARSRDFVPAHPTDWLVAGVHADGHWPDMRRLTGIGDSPVILHDGRIVSAKGYDSSSGVYLSREIPVDVPTSPTRSHAEAAARVLMDLVSQFDFSSPAHASAWLCSLLTVVGRFAFRGSSPLMLVDASTPGSGKTLLVDLVSAIAFGRKASRCPWSTQDEEVRKTITATAMAGDRILLYDNIPNGSVLQSAALDAALTSEGRWSSRILGTMEKFDGPLHCVFFATGNNVSVGGDLARRVLHVRLEPTVDRPELRSGWRYQLPHYAHEHRAHVLGAALTILRAHTLAGRPQCGLPAWGSFEAWSHTIRDAVVWAGLADPGETREQVHAVSDHISESSLILVAELKKLLSAVARPGRGLTARAIIQSAMVPDRGELRDAIDDLCVTQPGTHANPRQLARVLSSLRSRRYGGLAVTMVKNSSRDGAEWTVV